MKMRLEKLAVIVISFNYKKIQLINYNATRHLVPLCFPILLVPKKKKKKTLSGHFQKEKRKLSGKLYKTLANKYIYVDIYL